MTILYSAQSVSNPLMYGLIYGNIIAMSKVVGSWHDCINPLGLPPHAHFFETNETINIYYANKICPMCWDRVQPDRTHIVKAAPGWFEKKYPTRNDRADMLPSSTYDD